MAPSSAVLEVALSHSPVADGFGDAGDELANSGFALGSADLAVQVFRGHDVGGGHRPVFGDFDVLLLEDHVALGIGDLSEAEIPFDFVVGGNAGLGEEAAEGEAGGLLLGVSVQGSTRLRWIRLTVFNFCHQGLSLIRFYGGCADSGVRAAGGESGWRLVW